MPEARDKTGGSRLASAELAKRCAELVRAASSASLAREYSVQAKRLAEDYPSSPDAAVAHALIRECTRDRDGMLELWSAVHDAFPDNFVALRYRIRWLVRKHQQTVAAGLINTFCAATATSLGVLLQKGVLLNEARCFDDADRLFEGLLKAHPDDGRIRAAFAQTLAARGDLSEALDAIAPMASRSRLPPSAARLVAGLTTSMRTLDALMPGRRAAGEDTGALAIEAAVRMFAGRAVRKLDPGRLGSVAFVTGGLGAGGSERQLCRTVVRLERLRRNGVPVRGIDLVGPFEVVVKSHSGDCGNDFFLGYVRRGGVPTAQINDMPVEGLDRMDTPLKPLKDLLPILPANVKYGVQRLTRHFRERRTDVAYLWQDGTVLFAALAALMEGVPRIVVCLRGLPPVTRTHRNRPEYSGLYRALLSVPGVQFAANSRSVARAYSEWLDADVSRFFLIYNGVHKLTSQSNGNGEAELWAQFAARTGDASLTVGSVFRFEVDKRPALWLRAAQEYLKTHPRTRFILVGCGSMFEESRAAAERYGIHGRVLFVGRSNNVGYWLSKMDVFLLLSRYEGLPNVLIEAHLAGLGVVSTPAGGAEEAFTEGVTGFALSGAESPALGEIVEKIRLMSLRSRQFPDTPNIARREAGKKFSVRRMLDDTVTLLASSSAPDAGAIHD